MQTFWKGGGGVKGKDGWLFKPSKKRTEDLVDKGVIGQGVKGGGRAETDGDKRAAG